MFKYFAKGKLLKIMKITTTTQAKKDGLIIDEILSIPSEIVNVNGGAEL